MRQPKHIHFDNAINKPAKVQCLGNSDSDIKKHIPPPNTKKADLAVREIGFKQKKPVYCAAS
jgi:hypothetical protein